MPYLSRAKIKGRDIVTLGNYGKKFGFLFVRTRKKEQLTLEYIFVKQTLDLKIRSLLVAQIEIDVDGSC